ncbi:MAG: family 10 glycosylhydrolase [Planctomycetota bacterium]
MINRSKIRPGWAARVAAFSTLLLAVGLATSAPAEVRGTWLTTTGPDHIRSGFNTASVMSDLRDVGVNTVYIETWKRGDTNFASPTMDALIGRDRAPFLGTSRDLVAETVVEAHRNEMIAIGWFEYGFMTDFIGTTSSVQFASQLTRVAEQNGWLLQDQQGRYGNPSNGFAWMNPAVPEVRQLLIDITLEAIDAHDLDGIQFDDRLAWPREFGWDTTTATLYASETQNQLPTDVNDPEFRAWRQLKVTQFALELAATIRATRPDLHISVSPSITAFSETNFNADWPLWQDLGFFDEYAVQVYRSSYLGTTTQSGFASTFPVQEAQFAPGALDEFVVGLRGNGTGANTPWPDLELMLDDARASGAAGHSIFYSKAVRDDYDAELTAYYDVATLGHAENPLFPTGHRPAPTVATPAGADTWTVDVPADGNYRIIAQQGGDWVEVSGGWLPAGTRELTVFAATGVELLVDRREPVLPDFNDNGVVDLADYTIWRDTLGSTTDLRADANGDLVVDELDYDLWNAAVGQVVPMASASIPEPAAVGLLLVALSALAERRTV